MKRAMKRGLPVLAVGLAVGAAAVLAPNASAAEQSNVTFNVTLTRGDSVLLTQGAQRECYEGFVVGVPKAISLAVDSGTQVHVSGGDGCYRFWNFSQVEVTSADQVFDITL